MALPDIPTGAFGGAWSDLDREALLEVKFSAEMAAAREALAAADAEFTRCLCERERIMGGVLGGLGEKRALREALERDFYHAQEERERAEARIGELDARYTTALQVLRKGVGGGGGGVAAGDGSNSTTTTDSSSSKDENRGGPGLSGVAGSIPRCILGSALAPGLTGLLSLVAPYIPNTAAASHTRSLLILSSGPHSLLGKASLLEALTHPSLGNPGVGTVCLGGLLGVAWVSFHPSTRGTPFGAAAAALGKAACGALYWGAAESPLARAAANATRAGITILPPSDLTASPHHGHADPRLWNPCPPNPASAPLPAVAATTGSSDLHLSTHSSSSTSTLLTAPILPALPRILKAALRKPIPGEAWDYEEEERELEEGLWVDAGEVGGSRLRGEREAEAEDAEADARADEDYDSDDSADMEDLLQRNNKRKNAALAAAARAAVDSAVAAATAQRTPSVPTSHPLLAALAGDASALAALGPHPYSLAASLPTAPGALRQGRRGGGWTPPWGVEGALWEHEGGVLSPGLESGLAFPVTLSPRSQPELLSQFAAGEGGAVLDVGPRTSGEFSDAVTSTCKGGGAVYMCGTLGVCELAEGMSGTQDVLLALESVSSSTFLVGGSVCAVADRVLAHSQGLASVVKLASPGAGVALMLAVARSHPALSTCAPLKRVAGLSGLCKKP